MLARLTGRANGVPNIRTADYPGPVAIHDEATIARNVREVLAANVIEALTKAGDTATAAKALQPVSRVVCEGTFDEINDYFAKRDWTDGLPIVPPTEERVAEFVRAGKLPADERIAVLPSANLLATPRNIAVNAIMAGCRPHHMPLLIAATRALGDERCSLANLGSTSTLLPYVVVNGPAQRELGIESGGHLISKGANPAIGRAVGLIVRNIAGYRPGGTYMGTFGYPLVFTLAEDDDMNPWEPFHVEQGFAKTDNTVSIGVTNNWGPLPSPSSDGDQSAAQTILDLICREVTKKDRMNDLPGSGPNAETAMLMIVLSPPVAQSLAAAGYSKRDIKEYVYENARLPLREFQWLYTYTTAGLGPLRDRVEKGIYPPEFLGDPESMVRIVSSPDILHIIVCGDTNRNRLMVMVGGHTEPTTKKFEV